MKTMKPKLILGLALVLSGGLFGCSTSESPHHTPVTSLPDMLKQIEQRVPELVSIGMTAGIPASGQVWHGEEYASGGFFLRQNPRYHPAGEFPRETKPVPYVDIYVTITRYASSSDAQKDLKMGLLRNQGPQSKESYKGAALYQWLDSTKKTANVVCQSGRHIVEITPYNREGASPLVMKVLDAVLAKLEATSSKSNSISSLSVESFQFIGAGTTMPQVIAKVGLTGRRYDGSFCNFYHYRLGDGTDVTIGVGDHEKILFVQHGQETLFGDPLFYQKKWTRLP